MSSVSSLCRHSRKFSQHSENEGTSSSSHRSHPSNTSHDSRPPDLVTLDSSDAVHHLRKTFPPLEFPPDVAQRMTTHISWNRGVDGHNGRLGFVGRRVLHTYLLLFLHECTLPPPAYNPSKSSPVPPSARLRPSALSAGGPIDPLSESYDDISEKLLNTYALGEHVGAAWELERIMRWTPAVAELDTFKAASPHTVLRSSGLYKVRGATVEGVVGGIFHQFGGSIAHRVFHTRVLPHISHLGLPKSLRARVEEACQRLGGHDGMLVKSEARGRERERVDESFREGALHSDRLGKGGTGRRDAEYTRVDVRQKSRERRRMGYVG